MTLSCGPLRRPIRAALAVALVAASLGPRPGGAAELRVTVFHVGPGNCVLVQCPDGTNLLVDCGSHRPGHGTRNAVVSEIRSRLMGRGTTRLVLSHADKDHYNFVPYIFDPGPTIPDGPTPMDVEVKGKAPAPASAPPPPPPVTMGPVFIGGLIYQYAAEGTSMVLREAPALYGDTTQIGSTYARYLAGSERKVEGGTIQLQPVTEISTALPKDVSSRVPDLSCGDVAAHVLTVNSHPATLRSTTNPQSLVLLLRYGKFSILFPGDATQVALHRALEKAAASPALLRATVMVAPHHGSETEGSADPAWAAATRPQHLIFTADYPSQELHTQYSGSYGHPTEVALGLYLGVGSLASRGAHAVTATRRSNHLPDGTSLSRTITYYLESPTDRSVYNTGDVGTLEIRAKSDGRVTVTCSEGSWCGGAPPPPPPSPTPSE